MVKPIMRNHGWSLPNLSEFFPKNPNLYGINIDRGAKICLRLRPAHDPHSFLDFDFILGTMLHELTHNIRYVERFTRRGLRLRSGTVS